MEFFLHLWDEIDDVGALCRPLWQTFSADLASLLARLRAWGGALNDWVRPAAQADAP